MKGYPLIETIVADPGVSIHTFQESDFNQYVITGPQQGSPPDVNYLGRLVQVRLEAGMFGSNVVLTRHADGVLRSHENQWFHRVKPEYLAEVQELFKDVYQDDPVEQEYSIQGRGKAFGFIVPSPVREGETTPMREVKTRIKQRLNELLTDKDGADVGVG